MDQGNGNQKSHYGFSALEKDEVWERWARGETLKAIGRVFGKPSSSIRGQLSPYGGIRPAPRRRSKLALTLSEREEISRGSRGGTICTLFGKVAGPCALDGEPRDSPQWGL